jgi:LmbE family N-acetylglucosaminyl deacetylase
MRTVLGIWAHPDDEVFTSGGFMAEAVRRGDRVVCLHLTKGEAGLYFRQPYPAKALASIREQELHASLERLGVTEQRFLELPDGGLPLVAWDDAVVRLYDVLAEVDPDTILTFGPDGYTGHPDHKTISSWVSAATKLWDKPQARVLHATVPREWQDAVIPRLNEFDFFYPGQPRLSTRSDIAHRLDDDILDAKVDALRAHASQMEHLFEAYGEPFLRDVLALESFREAPRPEVVSQEVAVQRCLDSFQAVRLG